MEKEILEIYNELKEKNNQIIKEGKSISPFCFLIDKNNKIQIIVLSFENAEDKEKKKQMLKGFLVNQDIKGYIFICDTKMTMIDRKSGKKEVYDVAIRNLYTPKETLLDFVKYKGNEIIENIDTSGFEKNYDEWNLWGTPFDIDDKEMVKVNELYQKYKEENKEKYKGVYE